MDHQNSLVEYPVSYDQSSTGPLQRKLGKILESRLDSDKETLDALKVLSITFTENNLRNRRNLRSDIEKRSLQINEEFLQSFTKVKQSLDELCGYISSMNQCCNDMVFRLKATKSRTCNLISQTTKLQAESQKIQTKQEVAQMFLNTFQLKVEELKILRDKREGNLDEDFFGYLHKVKRIHNNCKVLLRSSQQTAGIEIMESMALLLESAYERLYRWSQGECRLLNAEAPDINPILCEAMQCLQDRPILFNYTLDEYSNARRTAAVRSFIDALTRGGTSGMPKPIELHSDDPLRYVGDMLAWLHQTSALEKEMLGALLQKCNGEERENKIQESLSRITEGLCRPLKIRVEQVLMSEKDAITLFKLCSLLKFYGQTVRQVIVVESQLPKTLEEMQVLCQKMFHNSLTCHCIHFLEKVEIPPANLGPTEGMKNVLTLLRDVLSCQDSCLVSVDDRQQDVPQILTTVVDPLLQMCHMSASKLATADMAAYLANCIYLIHATLSLFEFSDKHVEMLQAQMDAHLDTLVSEQASNIVGQLGLGSLYTTLQDFQPIHNSPLSSLPGCDPLAVQSAAKKIDVFLTSPDSMAIPQSYLLLSASLRQSLRKRSIELFFTAYKQIYEAINLAENNYPDSNLLLPRTPEDIRALLF